MEKIKISFRELWKAFTQPDATYINNNEDVSIEEIIKSDTTISEEEKEMMLKEIAKEKENSSKLASRLFENPVKKESPKAVKKWKEKNSEQPINVLSDEVMKKTAEKKAENVEKDMGISR